ncbi:hypothetical protein [Pontibacter rugosus]|uniref:Uncharacterized protein n=1 Tax=Pontibacter rugosus TaxID=1745966 RepID=A0ABW3SJ97_9BACT
MPALFATGLDRPLLAHGYPLTLTVAVSPDVRQQLYFERVYRGSAGKQLAIRSTLVEARGLVLLHDQGPWPVGTSSIEASVTNRNRASEADPERVVPVAQVLPSTFATSLDKPVLHEGNPLHLSIGLNGTRQVVYLERVYLDQQRRQLAIRSDIIYDRNMLVGLNLHEPAPVPGTRYMEVSLTNQYRATESAMTLEYESLEWNELEYN